MTATRKKHVKEKSEQGIEDVVEIHSTGDEAQPKEHGHPERGHDKAHDHKKYESLHKKELIEHLEKMEAEKGQLSDRLLRTMAELARH